MRRSRVVDAGLDKLQELLLEMAEGDEISVPHAVDVSGLAAAHCEAVLEALTRAGLMMRLREDAYIRRHLVEPAIESNVVIDAAATADVEPAHGRDSTTASARG